MPLTVACVCAQLLADHTAEMMPVVYTPVVGDACERYGELDLPMRACRCSAGFDPCHKYILCLYLYLLLLRLRRLWRRLD